MSVLFTACLEGRHHECQKSSLGMETVNVSRPWVPPGLARYRDVHKLTLYCDCSCHDSTRPRP